MPITRTLALGIVMMFATAFGIATFDAAYAQAQAPLTPCCSIVNGKYIDLKTGKEVTPPKAVPHVAAPSTAGAKPPAAPSGGGGGSGYK